MLLKAGFLVPALTNNSLLHKIKARSSTGSKTLKLEIRQQIHRLRLQHWQINRCNLFFKLPSLSIAEDCNSSKKHRLWGSTVHPIPTSQKITKNTYILKISDYILKIVLQKKLILLSEFSSLFLRNTYSSICSFREVSHDKVNLYKNASIQRLFNN